MDGCCPSSCVSTPPFNGPTYDQDCGYNSCLVQAAQQTPPQDPAAPCTQCTCRNCTSKLDLCFNGDPAGANGDRAGNGTAKKVLCANLVNCGHRTGCRGTDCYGTGPFYIIPGPCRAEVEAATESSSAIDVLNRQNNLTYASGRANAVGDCADNSCAASCN
jgi:hypothetical protein